MKQYSIAIDGPASSGKSTIAQLIAKRLNLVYIDTGAMYRAVTYYLLKKGISLSDWPKIEGALDQIHLAFKQVEGQQHLFLNGQDVEVPIRQAEVTAHVSELSAIPFVRFHLVAKQQEMAEQVGVVMDGRDIGTVVLPNASYKFFFVADPQVRAERRFKENQAKGMTNQTLEEIKQAIIERDHYDSNRETSPLRQAEDAIQIDTSQLSIDQVVDKVLTYIKPQASTLN
ncbi:(d)CMP kinase [Vaginisenegalia massiliensis]|uniref:(d)CMP kinase n=1 Tax=Vaginisenegalia massiliensis TaxID=2058294 RepID=UPI000F523ACC|nr:(d)CMP kinase [Vaginisenegalia massiliensis]